MCKLSLPPSFHYSFIKIKFLFKFIFKMKCISFHGREVSLLGHMPTVWAFLVAQLLKYQSETLARFLGPEDPWRRDRLPTPVFGFPGGSDGKESACIAGDVGSISGLGRSPGRGHGNPLQYSCLENPMDRGAWRATVHGVAKSKT